MTWIFQILMCVALLAPINRTDTTGLLGVVAEAVQRQSLPASALLNNPLRFTHLSGAIPDSGMTWAEYQVAMAYLGTLQYTVSP